MGNGASYITLAEAAPSLGQEVVQLIGQKQHDSAINVKSLVIAGTTAAALLVKKRSEIYNCYVAQEVLLLLLLLLLACRKGKRRNR